MDIIEKLIWVYERVARQDTDKKMTVSEFEEKAAEIVNEKFDELENAHDKTFLITFYDDLLKRAEHFNPYDYKVPIGLTYGPALRVLKQRITRLEH